MARFLLVDGHSIIFAWPELRALQQRRGADAREALIRRLEVLHDTSTWKITIVFDGNRHKPNEDSVPGGIQIFYSKKGQTADSIIERLAARYGSLLTVATNDLAERNTVEALGASAMNADQLASEIRSAEALLSQRIKALKPPPNHTGIPYPPEP
jgi:hypothetical protein